MSTYFKPLRRKVGVATLMIACVLCLFWVRSFELHEELLFVIRDGVDVVASGAGTVGFAKLTPVPDGFRKTPAIYSEPISATDNHDFYWKQRNVQWRWTWGGFDFGTGLVTNGTTADKIQIDRWAIPYWAIILPMTLLSAWLLFSRHRASKLRPAAEP